MELPGEQYAQMFSFWTAWAMANAATVLTALVILIIGWYAAAMVSSRTGALLTRTGRIDSTIRPVITRLVRYAILALTGIIVLSQFGVQTASILAVLGAIGLAVALALQGTLSNIAAGIMLIWLRPFSVGEYIDGEGIAGTVVEIGLFGTQLRTYDGVYTFTPNSRLWSAKIINYSREKTRMVDIGVRIAYAASIPKAREILIEMTKDPRVLPDPAPSVFVSELGESWVMMGQRVWVQSGDWWSTKIDFLERLKLAFDAAGIEIAHGSLDVYLREGNDRFAPALAAPAAEVER